MQFRLLPFFILFLITTQAFAQQETYLTHFSFNQVLYNPAYAGLNGNWCINSFHHRQWVGLEDRTGLYPTLDQKPSPLYPTTIAPVTSGFGFSMPINRRKSSCIDRQNIGGAYLGFINDVIGYEYNTSMKAGLSFAIPLNQKTSLRLGLDMNYASKRYDAVKLRPLMSPDPMLPVGTNPTDAKLLIGSGIYLTSGWNSFYAGLSMSSWNQPEFEYFNMGNTITKITAARHAYFNAGMSLPRGEYKIQPAILIKSANSGLGWVIPQMDAQCNVVYKNMFSFGLGLRGQASGMDAFSGLIGLYPGEIWPSLQPENGSFRIGYGYDVTLQSLRSSSRNSHEIQLNYCFAIPCKRNKIRHPRDLMFHEKARIEKGIRG